MIRRYPLPRAGEGEGEGVSLWRTLILAFSHREKEINNTDLQTN